MRACPKGTGGLALLALLVIGTACTQTAPIQLTGDDSLVDEVWVALAGEDLERAARAAERIGHESLARRAQLDLGRVVEGRAAALVRCLEDGHWLAARYDASAARARERLRARRRDAGDDVAWALERARRADDLRGRAAQARALTGRRPGGAEALALAAEALVALGRIDEAERLLGRGAERTGRLRAVARQVQWASGARLAAVEGVLHDVADGVVVPASLLVLEAATVELPRAALEHRVREVLAAPHPAASESAAWPGEALERARQRVLARLDALGGRLEAAAARVAALDELQPSERVAVDAWRLRARGRAPRERLREAPWAPERRIDLDPGRVEAPELARLRRLAEWDLAAREHYEAVLAGERRRTLDELLEWLDALVVEAPDALPRLSGAPRLDYGVLGTLVDPERLLGEDPSSFVLAGRALGMPAEVTVYDAEACRRLELPGPDEDYTECLVRRLRVPGFLASQGARFTGVGLDRVVFLDVDELDLRVAATRTADPPVALAPRPAAGLIERRDLSEPLDQAARLEWAAFEDDPAGYRDAVLASLAAHERQHVRDARAFLARGWLGRLGAVAGAGLSPIAVRAELERRAQLAALREAPDPRLPLALTVASLPVEGERLRDEHALGDRELLEAFVRVLDGGAVVDPRAHGISRGHVLVQQLERLPGDAIRAIARALPDG